MTDTLQFPYPQIPDPTTGGRIIYNGKIYIGNPDTDPTNAVNQVRCFYLNEAEVEIDLSQPIATNTNGLTVNPSGDFIAVKIDTEYNKYSLAIHDRNDVEQYYIANMEEVNPDITIDVEQILIDDLSQAYIFDTVALYESSTIDFPVGKTIHLNDRKADFEIVSGIGTADTYGTIANTNTNQSAKIIDLSNLSVDMFGADGTSDYDAITAALTTNSTAKLLNKEYVLSSALDLPSFLISDDATLVLSGKHSDLQLALFNGSIEGKVTFKGDSPVTATISNATSITTGVFNVEYYGGDFRDANYSEIELTLSAAAAVGDVLRIHSSTFEEYNGAYEVISINGLLATVMHIGQGTIRTGAFSATAEILTTVLQFSNLSPVVCGGGALHLEDIAILGACFPYAYDNRSNVYDPAGGSGVSGVVARRRGYVSATNTGVSGVSGTQVTSNDTATIDFTSCGVSGGGRNGISAASASKAVCNSALVTSNLLDGVISQDASFVFAKSVSTSQNGRHGVISSGGGVVNASSALVTENGYLDVTGDGVQATTGDIIAVGVISLRNSNAGIKGFNNCSIKATGANVQDNNYGVWSTTRAQITVSGTVNNNTTEDLLADSAGYILAGGAAYTNAFPAVNNYSPDEALIQTTTSLTEIKFSPNGNNTAMTLTAANQTAMGMSVVAGINSRAYIGGNALVKGDLYMEGDNSNYWQGQIIAGVLTWSDTGIAV